MRLGPNSKRSKLAKAVIPLMKRFASVSSVENSAEVASGESKSSKTRSKRKRLVVRMDDRWVDLTGWRNAHPAGSHWIDVFDKADATEVMHAFHSDSAHQMLQRIPDAKPEHVPTGDLAPPEVTSHTRNFRALREQLNNEGWFKRQPLMEAGTLAGWVCTMAAALALCKSGKFALSAVMLGLSNTSAGWLAHDYIHGRGKWASFMRGFGELAGGMSGTWWSDKHNMHHALTNVVGVDEDLMVDPALFLWAPSKENDNPMLRKIQHWYWALPYSSLFALWRVDSLKVSVQRKLWGEATRLGLHYALLFKLFNPLKVCLPAVFFSGLLTATIVTVSHVTEDLFFDGPHKADFVETQFRTTRDFVCSNPIFEYFAGGMNYQLEHHLFPTMPRYKYPALVPVIKQFAAENGFEYKVSSDAGILKRTVQHLKHVANLPVDPAGMASRSEEWVMPAAKR